MSKRNRNRTPKYERIVNQIQEQNTFMTEMRLKRIDAHPLDVKGNYIVMDNLECGVIEILELNDADTPLYLQWDSTTAFIKGATLVGKISIGYMEGEENDVVVVKDIYYKEGYTELRGAMFNQVLNFAEFYNRESVAFHSSVLPEWLAEEAKDK